MASCQVDVFFRLDYQCYRTSSTQIFFVQFIVDKQIAVMLNVATRVTRHVRQCTSVSLKRNWKYIRLPERCSGETCLACVVHLLSSEDCPSAPFQGEDIVPPQRSVPAMLSNLVDLTPAFSRPFIFHSSTFLRSVQIPRSQRNVALLMTS